LTLVGNFFDNGDIRRVESVVIGETILFIGGYYEKKGSEITKHYFAGAIVVKIMILENCPKKIAVKQGFLARSHSKYLS